MSDYTQMTDEELLGVLFDGVSVKAYLEGYKKRMRSGTIGNGDERIENELLHRLRTRKEALENLHEWTSYLIRTLPPEIQTDGWTRLDREARQALK